MRKLTFYIVLSFLILIALIVFSSTVGVYKFNFSQNVFFSNTTDAYVLKEIRLPRILMGALIGSLLAVSGTCLQGVFKNPLATPDLIGVTAGATLLAAVSIVLGSWIKPFLPVFIQLSLTSLGAFLGALIAILLVYKISSFDRKTNVVVMLLSGVAISSLAFSLVGFLVYMAKDDELRDLTFWNLGSLGGATWKKNSILLLVMIFSYLFLINKGKALNALMLGEKDAEHLGFDVEKLKRRIILLSALMVGVSVSFAGNIGFVGLIVPYVLRLIFKSNYTYILPLSAFGGAVLLVLADTISRTVVAPAELPIGILTSVMGAPIFIWILIRFKKTL